METIAEKLGLDLEILKNLGENSRGFLLAKNNRKNVLFEVKNKELNVLFRGAKLIKSYFKITGESSSSYYVWGGKLYINTEQLENYVSRINVFERENNYTSIEGFLSIFLFPYLSK